ncbi:MAG: hypothetical protein IJQ39_08100 [Thermoguttaceae bacterium]|nr:hypothetical protein [Thermoguttaceae bacterium]
MLSLLATPDEQYDTIDEPFDRFDEQLPDSSTETYCKRTNTTAEFPSLDNNEQLFTEYYERHLIKYGNTEYPLLKEIKLTIYYDFENMSCSAYESVLNIRSEGSTTAEAKHKWIFEFHRLFQHLASLAPFEKTAVQIAQQKWFDEIIDMDAYRAMNPLHCHWKGRVAKIDNEQVQIEWLGRRITNIAYEQAPSDFLLFKENDWFDAVIELDFHTGNVLKIIDVVYCGDPSLTPQQQDKFWEIVNS